MLKPTPENTEHNLTELFYILKELSVKNKALSKQDKELSKNIFTSQVLKVLNNTYDALNYLDEKYILNTQLAKFENNPDSINRHIEYYQRLADKAKENEDENLQWRYLFSSGTYEEFKSNHDKALQALRLIIASNLILDSKVFYTLYMQFLEKKNLENYKSTDKNYKNRDLVISLYGQLEGYKISHEQIIKSAGLKIFNFFEFVTEVQKKSLAERIEHIFASLGEDVSIDAKRASNIRAIGEFNNMILLDYESNKKGVLEDFGLAKAIENMLTKIVKDLKKARNFALIAQINKNKKLFEAKFIQQLLS